MVSALLLLEELCVMLRIKCRTDVWAVIKTDKITPYLHFSYHNHFFDLKKLQGYCFETYTKVSRERRSSVSHIPATVFSLICHWVRTFSLDFAISLFMFNMFVCYACNIFELMVGIELIHQNNSHLFVI